MMDLGARHVRAGAIGRPKLVAQEVGRPVRTQAPLRGKMPEVIIHGGDAASLCHVRGIFDELLRDAMRNALLSDHLRFKAHMS